MLVLFLGISGCAGSGMDGACTEIVGKRYLSTTKFVCNTEPVATCQSQLQFTAGNEDGSKFLWVPDDSGISGTVRCDGNAITAESNGTKYEGTWDPDSGALVWAGAKYEYAGPALNP